LGAVPGAVYGGEIGLTVGLWLLEYLGLAVLAIYVANAFSEAGKQIGQGLKRAWTSCGSSAVINASAQEIGEGFGHFFDVLFQAIVAYVAEEGMAAALKGLNRSKIAVGLGRFFRTETFKEATVSYWLNKLGKPREPKLVRDRVAVAIEFVRDKAKGLGGGSFPAKKIGEVLQGTDFNTPVANPKELLETFKAGESLVQRPDSKWGGGNWFSKSGHSADSTGLAEGDRGYKSYKVLKPFEALKTRSAGIRDVWTTGRKGPGEFAQGGGAQYFGEKHVDDLVAQGYLKEVYQRPSAPTTPGPNSP
jgi:hypothetical protein